MFDRILNTLHSRPLYYLALAFCLSLAISLLNLSWMRFAPEFNLRIPPNKDLILKLTANLDTQSNTLKTNYQLSHYQLVSEIVGKPLSQNQQKHYLCFFNKLKLYSQKGDLLFSYEKKDKNQTLYQVAPNFTQNQRKQFFDFFQIDLSEKESSLDNSLLKKSFTLALNPKGGIGIISMDPLLKRRILTLSEGSLHQAIVEEGIEDSFNTFTFFNRQGPKKKWQTSGEFLQPLVWQHVLQDEQNDQWHVKSYAKPLSKKITQAPRAFLQELKLTENRWQLDWHVDKKSKVLKGLKLDAKLALENQLLDHKVLGVYDLSLELDFNWQQSQALIADLFED